MNKLERPDRVAVAVPQEERSLAAVLASDLNGLVSNAVGAIVATAATAAVMSGKDKGGTPPAPPPPDNPSELQNRSEIA